MSTDSPRQQLAHFAHLQEILEQWVAEYPSVKRAHPKLAPDLADDICDMRILIADMQRASMIVARPDAS